LDGGNKKRHSCKTPIVGKKRTLYYFIVISLLFIRMQEDGQMRPALMLHAHWLRIFYFD
jgi:hypothetical protein